MRRTTRSLLLTTFTAIAVAGATPATAAPERHTATLDGKPIDLSQGWGDATSCLVRSESENVTDTVCHRSAAEANASLGFTAPTGTEGVSSILDCPAGWLCLWDGENGTGRRLLFSDEYWHELSTWNFVGQTSSYFNMQDGPPLCTSNDDPGGLQDWQYYSITLAPCSGQNTMGAWNNRASKVRG